MKLSGTLQTQELYHRVIEDLTFEVANSADIDISEEVVEIIKKNWQTKLNAAIGYQNSYHESQKNIL